MTVSLADIDLSDISFWERPMAEREAAFAVLRAQPAPLLFAEPEIPFAPPGPGYYALVRHADIIEASRHPDIGRSGLYPGPRHAFASVRRIASTERASHGRADRTFRATGGRQAG